MSPRRSHSTGSRRTERSHRPADAADSRRSGAPAHFTRYVTDGKARTMPEETSVADALAFSHGRPDRMAMFFYPAPSLANITELSDAWELHPLLQEDLVKAGQRPKLERYGNVLFLVARSARYIDEAEEVDFAEFHILLRPGAVAVLCQDNRWIDGTDGTRVDGGAASEAERGERMLLANESLLRLGPEAVLYRLLDSIVDGYGPVLQGLAIDKEQIERQVFSGDAAAAERIYRLSHEVIDMQQAVSSLSDVVDALQGGFNKYEIPDELRSYLNDVSDHLSRATSRTTELRESLAQILNVNSTLVAQRQNEDMKKISGWAAILFAPTLIAAIYGMNFDVMPELHWLFGYPMAIALMVLFAAGLFVVFKLRKWM